MLLSSSAENDRFSRHLIESVTCAGLLTPIRTEVMRSSFKIHERAICARSCPRLMASSFSLATLAIFSSVIASSSMARFPRWLAALEPSGMPFKYLLVKSLCASGENGIQPMENQKLDEIIGKMFATILGYKKCKAISRLN
jgi:hypothetical protein